MTNQTVPKLDLAPKLNRPLSLLNPLDYLRLLYWAFFFPQAIRWYVANSPFIPKDFLLFESWRRSHSRWQEINIFKMIILMLSFMTTMITAIIAIDANLVDTPPLIIRVMIGLAGILAGVTIRSIIQSIVTPTIGILCVYCLWFLLFSLVVPEWFSDPTMTAHLSWTLSI